MSPTNSPAEPLRLRPQAAFAIAAALLGIVSVLAVKLAVIAMTAMIISYLFLPKEKDALTRFAQVLLLVAVPLMGIGLLRFTIEEAAPGIIEGGRRHLVKQAIYHLREVRFAQDFLREQPRRDPDGDGVGSAGTLDELAGHVPFRGSNEKVSGLLRFPPTVAGAGGRVAIMDGYVIAVYLPGEGGRAVTLDEAPIDDERAERRWVAYAWPLEPGLGDMTVVFIDEHERILISDNQADGQRYFGKERMPRFDAALAGPTLESPAALDGARGQDGGVWRAWKGKQARASLPGDKLPGDELPGGELPGDK